MHNPPREQEKMAKIRREQWNFGSFQITYPRILDCSWILACRVLIFVIGLYDLIKLG